jgi:hypothetical protein
MTTAMFTRRDLPRGLPNTQQGAASLTVVMVLFLIVSLAAAYTSRNLIFEQRTAGNQYRSTQAFEAAEAGLEWTLAMLNSGRINASCQAGAATDTSFRQRYLGFDAAEVGTITPLTTAAGALGADGGSDLWPSCVFNGTDWDCSCPSNGAPSLTAPAGSGIFPAFRARFVRVPSGGPVTQPGVVRLEVNGCTRLDDSCLNFPATAVGGEGRATVSVLVALKSGLALTRSDTPSPAAALTVRAGLSFTGATGMTVVNADPAGGGLTLQTGTNPDLSLLRSVTVAGSPGSASVSPDDPALSSLTSAPPLLADASDSMFAQTFAAPRTVYLEQPAVLGLDCAAGCTAAQVRALAALHPGRMIHVRGNLAVDAGDVGSATDPVLLLLDGDLDLQDPAARIFGLVYAQAPTFAIGGTGEVRGAVVAENALVASSGEPTIVREAAVLRRLQTRHGSFVRVPGSWKDFP